MHRIGATAGVDCRDHVHWCRSSIDLELGLIVTFRHARRSEADGEFGEATLDDPVGCRELFVVVDETKTKIGGRHAGCTSAGAGITDEVGHIGPVRALHDANAAIGVGDTRGARRLQRDAEEAGVGPFPDIAAEILKPVLVAAEAADRLRVERAGTRPVGLRLVARDPGLRRIDRVDQRERFVADFLAGCKHPFLVGGKAMQDPGLVCQPA
jgi:hypothetical protein